VSEPPGFRAFYDAEFARVLIFLRKQGATWEESWDAAQEAFLEAVRRWNTIESPRAWVRVTSLRYHAHQRERRAGEWQRAISSTAWLPRPAFQEIQLKDEEELVLAALVALPPRQREVMAWCYDGYEPKEIAHLTGLSADAVRSNLYQARQTLKRRLATGEEVARHE